MRRAYYDIIHMVGNQQLSRNTSLAVDRCMPFSQQNYGTKRKKGVQNVTQQ